MFSNQKCKRCEEKFSKKYNFCPHCGLSIKEEYDDQLFEPIFKLGFPFNKLFKDLEKQMKGLEPSFFEEGSEDSMFKGISINIDTLNGQPTIRIKPAVDNREEEKEGKDHLNFNQIESLTEEKALKFSNLPREEAPTKVKRLSNRLIYEICLPGVKKEDVMISRMEKSIEVKAFSDEKAFFKIIPLSMQILKSHFKEDLLTLELKV